MHRPLTPTQPQCTRACPRKIFQGPSLMYLPFTESIPPTRSQGATPTSARCCQPTLSLFEGSPVTLHGRSELPCTLSVCQYLPESSNTSQRLALPCRCDDMHAPRYVCDHVCVCVTTIGVMTCMLHDMYAHGSTQPFCTPLSPLSWSVSVHQLLPRTICYITRGHALR